MVGADDAIAALTRGVGELADSSRWRAFLQMQAHFHEYSYRNVLLIARQCPHATHVAGFRAWRRLGRAVRRGERAIWILAPVRRTEDDRPVRFVAVPVFDVSQTVGTELPDVCRRLEGGSEDDVRALEGAARSLDLSIEWCELADGVNGECDIARRRIRVERRNAAAQRAKSLAHELAHGLLHADARDRRLAELEAESVAYVVSRHLGVESDGYSFGYLAQWAGDPTAAVAAIEASCARIAVTAGRIIAALG